MHLHLFLYFDIGKLQGYLRLQEAFPVGQIDSKGFQFFVDRRMRILFARLGFMLGAGTRSVLLRPIELAALAWTSGDAGMRLRAIVGIALVTALVAWPMVRMIPSSGH